MHHYKFYICVTPFFPSPNNWRGAYVLDQVKAIQRHSMLKVLVFMPSSRDGEYEIDNIKVYLFKIRQTPSYFFNGLFNEYNTSKFIERINSASINIDDIKFVHCHSGQKWLLRSCNKKNQSTYQSFTSTSQFGYIYSDEWQVFRLEIE